TAWATHSSLITGSMPGIAASTSDTCEFGAPPNAVAAPENSFAFELTWAWTSSPTMTSQSSVAPLMRFEVEGCTFIAGLMDHVAFRLRAKRLWRQGVRCVGAQGADAQTGATSGRP